MDTRKHAEKRNIMSFDALQPLTDCKAYILPEGLFRAMAEMFLYRGVWRSTYYTAISTNTYTLPGEAEFRAWIDAQVDALIGAEAMSCEIVSILEAINGSLAALVAKSCCEPSVFGSDGSGGSGGAGAFQPQTLGDEGLPENWTGSAEDYADYKCKAAVYIYNNLLVDLTTMSGLSLAGLIVVQIAPLLIAALVTPIPADDIAVLALLLLELALVSDQWADLLTSLDSIRGDLICAMLESSSAIDAVSRTEALVDAEMGGLFDVLDDVTNTMITIDQMNALFIRLPAIDGMAVQDCSDCECIPGPAFESAVPVIDGDLWTIEAYQRGGTDVNWYISGGSFVTPSSANCAGEAQNTDWSVRFVSVTGRTGSWAGKAFRIATFLPYSNYTGDIYSSDTQPSSAVTYSNVRGMTVKSATPFSMVIEVFKEF